MDAWKANYKSMDLDQLIKEKRRIEANSYKDKNYRHELLCDEINKRYSAANREFHKEFHNANNSH